jgi:hypothetical protein
MDYWGAGYFVGLVLQGEMAGVYVPLIRDFLNRNVEQK